MVFIHLFSVLDNVDSEVGIYKSEHREIELKSGIDLDYILSAKSFAISVFDECDRAIEVLKSEKAVFFQALQF